MANLWGMEIEDIVDRDSLERWLKDRPREDAMAIALRSALRVAPIVFRETDQKWMRDFGASILLYWRNILTLVASQSINIAKSGQNSYQSTDIVDAMRLANGRSATVFGDAAVDELDGREIDRSSRSFIAYKAICCAHGAYSTNSPEYRPAETANSVIGSVREIVGEIAVQVGSGPHFWGADPNDAQIISDGLNIWQHRLWSFDPPVWFIQFDQDARAIWAKSTDDWDFWVRWWDGVIAGKPLPWDLQTKVALIPDEDWQKGPAHIAEVIRGIEELYGLGQTAKVLKADFPKEILPSISGGASLAHRAHNQPPELVETPEQLQNSLRHIWAAIDAADRELEKPKPDRKLLRSIGERLVALITASTLYIAGLADSFIQAAVAELGKETAKWFVRIIASGMLYPFAERLIQLAL